MVPWPTLFNGLRREKLSYQVLARKWRPQSFDELVGQTHVSQTLLNALRSGRLPHALLFSGARGVGKTSSARIFAKSLRCPNAKDFVPCNQCSTCEDIAKGSDVNVIEIDGASNNGVDAIRELRETVGFMPSSGKFKTYIIDEVHMLSTSAFNALLKTLEEPPPHVVFIFATTEPQKIPVTILSRCQRFDFRRIPTRQIAERLKLICDTENVQYEMEALWTIARQAEGALRDSQSLLDQAITYCDNHVTQEKVTQVLGLTPRVLLLETLNALVHRDSNASMQVIEKLYSGGFDSSVFVQDLLEQLRHFLIVKLNPTEASGLVDLPESEIRALQELSEKLSSEDVHLLFDMTLKGANDLIRAQNPRVVLEMLLLRMANAPRVIDIAKLINFQGAEGKPATSLNSTQISRPSHSSVAPTKKPLSENEQPYTTSSSIAKVAPVQAAPTQTVRTENTNTPIVSNIFDTNKSAQENWITLIEKIKTVQPSLGAKLEYVSLIELGSSSVRLGTKDQMILEQLNEKLSLMKLQSFMKTYWSKNVDVLFETLKTESAPLSPKELTTQKEQKAQEDLMKAVENHPIIKKTQDTFKTKITSIKERS